MTELFEVEIKVPLKKKEGKRKVESRLWQLGFVFVEEITQYDYFLPGTVKGELLRIREEGRSFFQTHKERLHVDGTKVKRESEPEVHPISAHLILMGARKTLKDHPPTMFKRRREYKGFWKGHRVTIEIDHTPVLADMFSAYWMEVEIMVDNPLKVAQAKRLVREIAAEVLGKKRKRSKKSYRRMLFKALKKAGKFPKRWKQFSGAGDKLVNKLRDKTSAHLEPSLAKA